MSAPPTVHTAASSKQAIVLAGHGAGIGSPANAALLKLAQHVQNELGDRVHVQSAFNLGRPHFSAVIDTLDEYDHILVVPVMLAAGYFATKVLPERLQDNTRVRTQQVDVQTTGPVGTSEVLMSAIAKHTATQAKRVCDEAGTTIIVVGHGTRRQKSSGTTTQQTRDAIAALLPRARVLDAYLDQDPLLEDIAPTLTDGEVRIVPWLLGGGGHELEDIPQRLELSDTNTHGVRTNPHGVPVRVSPPLFERQELLQATLARIDEALGLQQLKLGTRSSKLARWQANAAKQAIERTNPSVRINVVELDTAGDADLSRPITSFAGDDPFTGSIEQALLDGTIDIAQHSQKDLPLEQREGLTVGAYLQRAAPADALVTTDNCTLDDLPLGATVGTCSVRRTRQLVRLRPDLVIKPIRGSVPARVEQVLAGKFDATVLAVAGLERLGMTSHISQVFTFEQMLPEAGQGAVALQHRAEDKATRHLLSRANHNPTQACVEAELAFARAIETDHMQTPAGTTGHLPASAGEPISACVALINQQRTLELSASIFKEDGSSYAGTFLGEPTDASATALGERAAAVLLERVAKAKNTEKEGVS